MSLFHFNYLFLVSSETIIRNHYFLAWLPILTRALLFSLSWRQRQFVLQIHLYIMSLELLHTIWKSKDNAPYFRVGFLNLLKHVFKFSRLILLCLKMRTREQSKIYYCYYYSIELGQQIILTSKFLFFFQNIILYYLFTWYAVILCTMFLWFKLSFCCMPFSGKDSISCICNMFVFLSDR